MSSYFAHSENSAGIKHDLVEHLKSVAQLAGKFAEKFGAADFGYWAGSGGGGSRPLKSGWAVATRRLLLPGRS